MPAVDPAPGRGGLQQAQEDGLALRYNDFILFSATIHGSEALRNVMIPQLISCLQELEPQHCMSQACERAKGQIQKYIKEHCDKFTQIPWYQSTLQKKLCIGKRFPPPSESHTSDGRELSVSAFIKGRHMRLCVAKAEQSIRDKVCDSLLHLLLTTCYVLFHSIYSTIQQRGKGNSSCRVCAMI